MTATFYIGDALETMAKLPAGSVDLILTSPPFLALRSYLPADHPDKAKEGGSQSTPGEFIDWLIDLAEASARILAPHGSFCVELGDTYSGSGGAGGDYAENGLRAGQPTFKAATGYDRKFGGTVENRTSGGGGTGWPLAKSLSLIPELFRLSLVYGFNPLTGRQTERWRLRNVVRWVRPNPPVGALGDKFRPATSELMVFCKSAKRYFDLDAVREPYAASTVERGDGGSSSLKDYDFPNGDTNARRSVNLRDRKMTQSGAPPLDWWNIPLIDGEEATRYGPKNNHDTTRHLRATNKLEPGGLMTDHPRNAPDHPLGAPPLDWWNIPPGGYEGAHYAVFPPELCVRPIKAMSPERVCRQCGEPSRRITEAESVKLDGSLVTKDEASREHHAWNIVEGYAPATWKGGNTKLRRVTAESWTDCGHDDWRPGLVLDPFAGSGTTLLVATGHGRDAIGIDLDARNYQLALQRVGPFLLELGNIDE